MAEVNLKKFGAFFEAAGASAVIATAETSDGESFLVLTAASELPESVEVKDDATENTTTPQPEETAAAAIVSEDEEVSTSESDQDDDNANESFTLRLRLRNHPFYKSEYIHLSDECIADVKRFMVMAGMGALGWIMGWTIGLSTGAASMYTRC